MTVLFLSVEFVSASNGRLEASGLYELWSEAEFQNFLSKPLEKFKEALAEKETELGGAGIFDVLEWIEGQFAFAITGTREVSSKKQILVFAMLMEIGDNEAKLRDWMEKLEPPAFGPEEFRRVEEDFRGTTIVSYLSRKDEDVDDPTAEDEGLSAGPPCWFVHEGLFAFADDPEALKAILVRRGGDEEGGLNTNAHYKTVLERCEGAGDLFMYFNLESMWGMLEGLKGADQSLAMALTAEVEQILTAIGVKEPQAGGMSMGFTDQGMIQRAFLESPAPRTGIMKFLDGENSGLQPPSFVPQDVTTAMTLAIDFQEIWKEARRIMDEIQPGMTEQMDDQFAQIKEQAGLDIEQDLIESLGKSITLYQFEPIPADPDAAYPIPTQRTVLAVEVSNAEKVKEALGILRR